jgi:hypothetical protein
MRKNDPECGQHRQAEKGSGATVANISIHGWLRQRDHERYISRHDVGAIAAEASPAREIPPFSR